MVYYKCIAPGCESIMGDPGKSFFRFPSDESVCCQWKDRVGFQENHKYANYTTKKCHNYLRLCSLHFEDACFYNPFKDKLRRGSIPTLFKAQCDYAEMSNTNMCQVDQYFCKPILASQEDISSSLCVDEISSKSYFNVSEDQFCTDKENKVIIETVSCDNIQLNRLTKAKLQDKGENDIYPVESLQNVIVPYDAETNDPLQSSNDAETPEVATYIKEENIFCLTPQNIDNVCRTCLGQKDVLLLSENKHEGHTYAEMLEICSTVKLAEGPSLSPYICQDCIIELLQAYKFREKCAKSQQALLDFKAELDERNKINLRDSERRIELILRDHDYESTFDKKDINITDHEDLAENIDDVGNRSELKRLCLLKGEIDGTEGLKGGGVTTAEIDETNAKTRTCDSQQSGVKIQLGNLAVFNIKTTVVQSEMDRSKNDSADNPQKPKEIQSFNELKIVPLSLLLRPAICTILNGKTSNQSSCMLKTETPPSISQKNPDKVQIIEKKEPVIPGNCHICNEPYNTLTEYKQHSRVTSHYLNPHVCEICGKIYADQTCLKKHKRSHDKPKPTPVRKRKRISEMVPKIKYKKIDIPGACHVCNEQYNTLKEYKQHSRAFKHYINPHVCETCGKVFPEQNLLNRHTTKHENRKSHMCEACGKCFKLLPSLRDHLKTHDGKLKRFACRTCDKTFSTIREVNHHRRTTHSINDKSLCCEFCGKFFLRRDTLRQHIKYMHIKRKSVLCQICGKGFVYESHRKKHMVIHSTDLINCKLCNKTFKAEHRYLQHMKTQHPGTSTDCNEDDERKCDYCDLVSQNKQSQTVHLRIAHKVNICIYCDHIFKTVDQLNEHMKDLHEDTSDFTCRYCGKSFEKTSMLYTHLSSHKPKSYQCTTCLKKFTNSTSLKAHINLHTGHKKFKCDICDKAFVHNSSYIIHKRIHSGERPYVCDICGKGSIDTTTYKNHMKIHIMPTHSDETLKSTETVRSMPIPDEQATGVI